MKILTEDGSETVYDKKYQEYYHSKSGAAQEAVEKYVKPCKIMEIAEKSAVKVLDIGFGLGYNVIAAIDAALDAGGEIEILSFEKFFNPDKLKGLINPFKHFDILTKLDYDPINNSYYYEEKNIFLKIKIGDASVLIKDVEARFDAVFLDPFSPSKNPELWTKKFFCDILRLMKRGAVLSTYSYAKKVRDNLKDAGFEVFDGPVVGRRSPCTLAINNRP